LNAFVIQFPDDLLDTCVVTAARALLLPFAHRGHCKDEDNYKECWSHVKFGWFFLQMCFHACGCSMLISGDG
jgi:hypothetical protein